MLFMQAVVVNDAHEVERATPAEVRLAEPRAAQEQAQEQPTWTDWTGTMLAQAPMDSRSPFGANAPDTNNLTPRPTPANPPAAAVTPPATPVDSRGAAVSPQQTDAGPPVTATPPTEPSTATPTTVPSTATPGSTTPGSMAQPTPGAGSTNGTAPNTTAAPPATSAPNVNRPSPGSGMGASGGTLPGQSSGASNTQ